KRMSSHKVRLEEIEGLRLESQQHSSRHVVRLIDSFYDDDDTVLIMEYVDLTLAAHRDNPSRPADAPQHGKPGNIDEFVEMAIHLCKGLEVAHQGLDDHGNVLIHGDIKAENIGAAVVAGEVVWKLLDFGLASKIPEGRLAAEASYLGGTPPYMSPQVLKNIKS